MIPKPELNADFFVSLLTGIKGEVLNLIGESGHGTKCLRTDSWENLFIPLPPVAEQIKIIGQLETELAGVNTAIHHHEREIDLLREYRTRLVADVVTGKLDVREAAAKLPVEDQAIEPTELVEDVSEMIEDEITEPAE